MGQIKISGLRIFANHGVYEEERRLGQDFYVNATLFVNMEKSGSSDELADAVNYGSVCAFMHQFLTGNTFRLLEKAVTQTIKAVLKEFPLLDGMEMELCKPQAPISLPFDNISVKRSLFWHTVYLSIGSNMGDKRAYLDFAKNELSNRQDIRHVIFSEYIVTKPYGGVKQDDFLNGAIKLQTLLSPRELLELLHTIESKAERKRTRRWGPRTLDLDIVFYDKLIYESDDLIIPHVDMHNREFVLKPLCELAPNFRHPVFLKTMEELKRELLKKNAD